MVEGRKIDSAATRYVSESTPITSWKYDRSSPQTAKNIHDGAGYDIESFTLEEELKYIEVKTTRGSAEASFFISANEVDFARQHRDNYYLYRVYDYEDNRNTGRFYVGTGEVEEMFELTPTQYRAVRPQEDQTS